MCTGACMPFCTRCKFRYLNCVFQKHRLWLCLFENLFGGDHPFLDCVPWRIFRVSGTNWVLCSDLWCKLVIRCVQGFGRDLGMLRQTQVWSQWCRAELSEGCTIWPSFETLGRSLLLHFAKKRKATTLKTPKKLHRLNWKLAVENGAFVVIQNGLFGQGSNVLAGLKKKIPHLIVCLLSWAMWSLVLGSVISFLDSFEKIHSESYKWATKLKKMLEGAA